MFQLISVSAECFNDRFQGTFTTPGAVCRTENSGRVSHHRNQHSQPAETSGGNGHGACLLRPARRLSETVSGGDRLALTTKRLFDAHQGAKRQCARPNYFSSAPATGTVARRRKTSSETRKSTKQDPPARALFAVRRVTQELIDWADQILVMSELDDGHLTFLETHLHLKGKAVYDLDIPDRYGRGSQQLINLLAARLARYLSR